MAMTIEVRQANDVPSSLIGLKKAETTEGYRSGRNWLLHEEPRGSITEA
jgi:hypothetical protein